MRQCQHARSKFKCKYTLTMQIFQSSRKSHHGCHLCHSKRKTRHSLLCGGTLDDKDARPSSHFLTEKSITYSVTLFCSLDYTVLSTLKKLPDEETAGIKRPPWKCQDHVRKHTFPLHRQHQIHTLYTATASLCKSSLHKHPQYCHSDFHNSCFCLLAQAPWGKDTSVATPFCLSPFFSTG